MTEMPERPIGGSNSHLEEVAGALAVADAVIIMGDVVAVAAMEGEAQRGPMHGKSLV